MGLAEQLWPLHPQLPGAAGARGNRSKDGTSCQYCLEAFFSLLLKLFSALSQEGVYAHNTASSCLAPVLTIGNVFSRLGGF